MVWFLVVIFAFVREKALMTAWLGTSALLHDNWFFYHTCRNDFFGFYFVNNVSLLTGKICPICPVNEEIELIRRV